MTFLLHLLVVVILTAAIVEIGQRTGINTNSVRFYFLASLPIPLILIALWIWGLWYIQSEHCTDANTCDAPGMLVMSFGTLFPAIVGFAVGLLTAVFWNRLRRFK